ncbi:MAG: amidohydrolase [Thermoleophilia bacterium]|nr:amidohydrolase [Thermoleophilia bacterium]
MAASLVIKNAKVVTVDGDFSVREAIAVVGDTIVAVGSNTEIEALIGPDTRVMDLEGRTILPGVNDAHGHPAMFGGTRPPLAADLYAPRVNSVALVAEEIKTWVDTTPPGTWIRGYGWDSTLLANPTRWDLDSVSPDHPLALTDFSAHNLWVNSKALELAGVTKDTPDPEGGFIDRDPATGEPTGMFREFAAMGHIMKVVPLLTKAEKRAAILSAMKIMNANGITSYTESALGPGGDTYSGGLLGHECAEVYQDLHREGNLNARVTVLALFGEYGALSHADLGRGLETYHWPDGLDPKWLRFPGVKIFADGVPMTKTSAMWEEYVDGGLGEFAIPGASEEEKRGQLASMIRDVCRRGLQVGVHATGDRAVSVALDALEAAAADGSRVREGRPYIIHADQVVQKDFARAAALGVGLNMQPTIMSLMADSIHIWLGHERALRDWPFGTTVRAGVRLIASSDMPVTYPNWREGVQAMVLREGMGSGKVSGPGECLSLEDAIRAYTINGAWQDHMDDIKGSIEPGKLADLCVLDADILTVDPHEIKNIGVVTTIVGGRIVYDASE